MCKFRWQKLFFERMFFHGKKLVFHDSAKTSQRHLKNLWRSLVPDFFYRPDALPVTQATQSKCFQQSNKGKQFIVHNKQLYILS